METKHLYWLAGLMEGEGCFGITNHRQPQIYAEVTSVDEDVIDLIDQIVKGGFRAQYELPSGKIAFKWAVRRQEIVAGLMMTLYSLMSGRRQRQIKAALDTWKQKPLPRKSQTHCAYGHPLSGDNLWLYQEGKYTKRRCHACCARRQREYNERRRKKAQ